MICRDFIHIGIGDTLEGVVRNALQNYVRVPKVEGMSTNPLIPWDDSHTDAHLALSRARKWHPHTPAFTFTRNPYDFYISWYMHNLKMHKWEGTFGAWMEGREGGFTKLWKYHTFVDGKEAIDHVGKCENLEDDLVEILHKLSPKALSREYIHSWFPEAYRQWCNRPWIEGIEQWLRAELYTYRLMKQVEAGDGWALDRWGYKFGQHYAFRRAGDD